MGHTYAELRLTNLFNKYHIDVRALVDTGATFLCVTEQIALQLGFDLEEVRQQPVTLADGRQKVVPKIAPVEIAFENRSYVTEALVLGDEPLLGVLPLEAMDLIVDTRRGVLLVNPQHPNYSVALAKHGKETKNMRTILVTGGAGFIGGNFVHHLIARSAVKVINLDLLTYAGNLNTLGSLRGHPRHVFVQGDIANSELVTQIFNEHKPDAVVHFAAESHVDRSIDGPAAFMQTNVMGTFKLLECVRQYWSNLDSEGQQRFRFLHVSTDEVYGSLGPTGYFTEHTPYAPNSPYSASKAASDHLVRAWHHTYGLPVLTTNCSNNYGPYQFPEKLIPLCIHKALTGQPLPIYGDGSNIRDWLYVEDHCRAIVRVLETGRPGQVYNVGGNSERTNLQVIDTLCELIDELVPTSPYLPHAHLKTFVTDRPGHDHRYAIDATKLMTELNWQPAETFDTGLRRTVQWYLDNKTWVQQVTDGSYRGERLGQTH